jgi:hypothetical protein
MGSILQDLRYGFKRLRWSPGFAAMVRHAVGYSLNESCAEALRQQIYRPAVYRGTPVAFPLSQSIHFQVGH